MNFIPSMHQAELPDALLLVRTISSFSWQAFAIRGDVPRADHDDVTIQGRRFRFRYQPNVSGEKHHAKKHEKRRIVSSCYSRGPSTVKIQHADLFLRRAGAVTERVADTPELTKC